MDGLTIAFIVIAGLSFLINLLQLIFTEGEKTIKFSATMGWASAIMWAIMY